MIPPYVASLSSIVALQTSRPRFPINRVWLLKNIISIPIFTLI